MSAYEELLSDLYELAKWQARQAEIDALSASTESAEEE